VTTDESILAGQLAKLPKGKYEIPPTRISDEPYGIGVRKGDKNLLNLVNETLLEMEKNGQAKTIFMKWFGPDSSTPLVRDFEIYADKRGLE
jgi:polar amino acid transport system substrate-binding protein